MLNSGDQRCAHSELHTAQLPAARARGKNLAFLRSLIMQKNHSTRGIGLAPQSARPKLELFFLHEPSEYMRRGGVKSPEWVECGRIGGGVVVVWQPLSAWLLRSRYPPSLPLRSRRRSGCYSPQID